MRDCGAVVRKVESCLGAEAVHLLCELGPGPSCLVKQVVQGAVGGALPCYVLNSRRLAWCSTTAFTVFTVPPSLNGTCGGCPSGYLLHMRRVISAESKDPRDRLRRPGGMALNHCGVENVLHLIARLVEPLLRLLWPPSGRHRNRHRAEGGARPIPVPAAPVVPRRRPSPHEAILRGEDSPLVRPYLLTHEQREHAKQQRARRRTLWLAVHGIDVGPRRIHGVDVGSRRCHATGVAAA